MGSRSPLEIDRLRTEKQMCWALDQILRDLTYCPSRTSSWLLLHKRLCDWLQHLCDELGDAPSSKPPNILSHTPLQPI